MTDLEGRVEVTLRCRNGHVAAVDVRNSRTAQAGRMFVGRRPDEVTAMLPLLFSLCGHAQLVAGLQAVEAAAGLVPAPATVAARRLMVAAETVLEHAQGILRDWPALLGEAPDLAAARGLRAALGSLRGTLYPGRDWAMPGGGRLVPDHADLARRLAEARRLVERAIFAGPSGYELADLRTWSDWAHTGATAAARLVRHIEDGDAGGFGAGPVALLPPLEPEALDRVMAGDDDGAFLARPTWLEAPRLTHPLARRAGHPLVSALLLAHGNGVLTLIAARLADLHAAMEEAEALLSEVADDPGNGAPATLAGSGLGMVQAARGLLAHRVDITDGAIRHYRILAPTEWTFHPDGVVAAGLQGVAANETLEDRVRMLIAALDPCVAATVAIVAENELGCQGPGGLSPTGRIG